MHPIPITITAAYSAEVQDPLHRHISFSNALYANWLEQTRNNSTDLSFNAWVLTFHNKARPFEKVDYIPLDFIHHYQVSFDRGVAEQDSALLQIDPKNRRSTLALIIMPNENLYAIEMATEMHKKRVHHSSISSGQPVYFAAEASIRRGIFSRISDKSGHYKPNLYSFVYGLSKMQQMGANFDHTTIEVDAWKGEGHTRFYSSALEFIKLYAENGFDSPLYAGAVENLDAIDLNTDSENQETNAEQIFFVKDRNELFYVSKLNGKNRLTSFYDKYQAMQAPSSPSTSLDSSEELNTKRLRFTRFN